VLLLLVQLLIGIMMMPGRNYISIFLNEAIALPVRQVAQVIAWGQVVGMFASLWGGSMSDRWGHKWVLVIGVAGMAVSSLLYASRLPWLVVVLWSLSGAGLGFATLSSQGYLTLMASAGNLGVYSALYNLGYTIGGAVGIPIAAVILGQDNFNGMGVALTGFGLFTILATTFMPHHRPSKRSRNSEFTSSGYGALIRRPRIILLGLLRFLPTCYFGLTTLLPLLIKKLGGSNADVAWFAAGSSVFASLTQLAAGRLSDRRGVRTPTLIAFGVILVSIVGTISTAQSVWGIYIFGSLGIGAAWALSTLLPGLVAVAAEAEVHGRVFGMLHLLWTLAMILGTLLGGELLEIDARLPFLIVGVLNVVAISLIRPFFRMVAPDHQPLTPS
jgi:MFS family permease